MEKVAISQSLLFYLRTQHSGNGQSLKSSSLNLKSSELSVTSDLLEAATWHLIHF